MTKLETTKERTRRWLVLVTGGLALSAFGIAGSPWAQAAPAPQPPSSHWCPGDFWDPGWDDIYNWDWNQCHDWQGPAGQGAMAGWGPWGPPPGWAPPKPPPPSWAPGAKLMYNPTVNSWGFWNNGIWTPV
ncbi:hypothetical protein [Mycobacterium asiaticum]|uniref:hypothetical protein n=1 Tax=Mycobacterium asiaticum TaxID=1790 RepID=UPI000A413F21|nr:hypothetical protein [Mycobacterium asiaticum]